MSNFKKIKDSFLGNTSEEEDFYELLGVNVDANEKEIEIAFNSMVSIYNSIENTTLETEKKIRKIKKAYNTLRNPIKRYIYDLIRKL